jgi:alkanesulfonate monooxygenase SsuD/methylene tetrahydromethanopterin reductase-like flavin-dependent oxidoreductase (luciferase family)
MGVAQLCPRANTVPLHNPLILAGAIAEADLFTHGRLACGLGRGHAWLFPPASIPLAESRPHDEEALDLLMLAWTQEQFSYEGAYYHVRDVSVVPKPLQKPHPKLYMVGTSESSFIAAGTRGVSIAAGGPVPYAVYAPGIEGYKKACATQGYTPDISFIRLVYLDEDARQVRTEAARYVRHFLDFNASAIDSLAHHTKELHASGYGFYTSGVAERFRHITYDQCIEEELCFLGTPAQVSAQIRRLDQQMGGLNEMVIISNFGGIEPWKAMKTQQRFAQYVMPALRQEGERSQSSNLRPQ